MAHADQITNLPLLDHLRQSVGRDDISEAEVDQLVGMVLGAADTVGPLLDRIPLTFRQYTTHDLRHSANLIKLMGKFIPASTMEQLNAVEMAILALSAILHDVGMFVSDAERKAALKSESYRRFEAGYGDRAALLAKAREAGEHLRAATLQDALLAEYFRRLHPERAEIVVKAHLAGKLEFRGTDLTPAVLRVCVSHGWGVLESNDPRDPEKAVARLSTNRPLPGVPVNEQYLACCLRLADIMDFDRSRTPASVFQHLSFTEEKSWEEWNKHLQVKGWHVDEHEVRYAAPCSHPAFYVAVMEFLDWIDAELRECRVLVREAPKPIAERYELNLPPVVDRRQVEMEDRSYLAGAFRFQLDYERIMQLLMDKSLYPDPSLFLRELLQNALDACRTREAHAKAAGAPYEARIAVWDYSDDPNDPRIVFQDNGIGMSRRIVENYFMRVGRSYYKSAEFDVERQRLAEAGVELEATSQFGIGILSCFMVADHFEVETYRVGSAPLRIKIEGPTKYFTIQQLPEPERTDFPARPASDVEDGPPKYPGTRLTIHLRSGTEIDVAKVLDSFAVNLEYEMHLYRADSSAAHTVATWRWRNEELTPSKAFKLFSSRDAQEEDVELPASLDLLLTPVRVPLEKYDFASHLDGQAWIWLLSGPAGEARPSMGYLKFGRALECSGAPAFVGKLQDAHLPSMTSIGRLVDRVADGIANSVNPFADPALERSLGHRLYFSREWEDFSPDERNAVLRWLTNAHKDAVPWYDDEGAAVSLLRGYLDWADCQVDFDKSYQPYYPTEALAFHGVRLPAGIVYWDPMMGMGGREEFFFGHAGFAVDIRGGGVKPAASRLFIDYKNAQQVIVPLLRTFVRFALSLVENSEPADMLEWRRWFGEVIVPSFRNLLWEEAFLSSEFTDIERINGYLCKLGTARVVLSRSELISTYGPSVPVFYYGEEEGLIAGDPMNAFLVGRREPNFGLGGPEKVNLEEALK